MRGFPTLWRLATEFFFLRKLAPRTELFNAVLRGGFDHDEVREVDFVMGACMLVRRAAIDAGRPGSTRRFFLFSEETDWCYRFRQAGWKVVFFPGAEVVHVYGASHGGRMFRENRPRATCASSPSTTARARPSARGGCCSLVAAAARRGRSAASVAGVPRRGAPGSPPAHVAELLA